MLRDSTTMSGFSVDDPEAARTFYEDTLGLRVEAGDGGFLRLKVADGRDVLVYPAPQHRPGSYTVLNFEVPDIEAAVRDLTARGVVFEKYAGTEMATDDLGVFRKGGPLIAWFTDPAGNVLSVLEQPDA
ncbi:VOC family protein [Nocardioides panacis]|uniref:VOC family protein n=1 Tax=Nocardioides panacis TaxID=2849501 RepID=A0A975SXH3_9ACTN|nr:VOC family protein [Nocardioides panacis]QWZ07059.1 VOC family protein [Nocardioides panacis]